MTKLALLALLVTACGSSQRPANANANATPSPPPASPESVPAPASVPEPVPDPCDVYALAMKSPLARLDGKITDFVQRTITADQLADTVDDERRHMGYLRVPDDALSARHEWMTQKLDGVSQALRARDADRLNTAVAEWLLAVDRIREVCPRLQ